MKDKHTEVEQLQARIDDLTEALQRERADATNVRRRAEEEKARLSSTHKDNIIRDILPVVDNFERALKHDPEDIKEHDYIKGISAVVRQFEEVLTKIGVTKIEAVGQNFDPNLHDAVSHNEDGDKDVVTEELQSGYMLDDQVIRHSTVKVN